MEGGIDSEAVQGAGGARVGTFHDVQINHGGGDIGMAEEVLDGADVGFGFEEVGGEGMAQGVGGDALGDSGLAHGVADLARHGVVVEVIAGEFSGARVRAEGGGGEEPVPTPLATGVGPFAEQGLGHVAVSGTGGETLEMVFPEACEVSGEPRFEGIWQGDDTVFAALAIVDGDGALAEIEVLDAQAHGYHEAEAAAVHDLGDEFPRIFQAGEHGAAFLAGHDDGRAALATGRGDGIEGEFPDAEHGLGEEDHGVECLFLGGGRRCAGGRGIRGRRRWRTARRPAVTGRALGGRSG